MNWIALLVAGIMEIGWVISLKHTEGFTKFIPILFYGFFGFTSAFFFSQSLKSIPMGIAYAIWMGIAVIGITVFESVVYQKPYDLIKLFFLSLIAIGIIGLKLIGGNLE
ncbi:MAG: multidrug efflux SMR transporter [Melioribacteraceae bacterium]|nr:multidrug efflux SMR transporter [Melioribacteraceae bacterium]